MVLSLRNSLSALWCCALFSSGAGVSGCSGSSSLDVSQGPCVEGQSSSCSCSDGSLGARRCGSDSEYGVCQCGQPMSGGIQSSNPIAGSGMTAGDGFAGDGIDPMAGTGAGGISGVGGSAGTMIAGAGGLSGSGAGGMATGGTGVGGSGGSGGMSIDPVDAGAADGGNSGPGTPPGPGELYGDCLANGSCNDGMLCVSDGSSGTPMSYCTTTCGGLGNARCPRSHGDRMATCVLGICVR